MKQLVFTKHFQRRFKKLVDCNIPLKDLIDETLNILSENCFDPRLLTHKAKSRLFGIRYSSKVSGDLRIVWDFDPENKIRLLLLDLGGHSGKHAVYS